MKHYLAIDIGASSGRHTVGWHEGGETKTKEVYRFPNGALEQAGHLVWDIDALPAHVKAGIAAAKAEFPDIVSLSIDTWGVDYVLLDGDKELTPANAYRDGRTEAVSAETGEFDAEIVSALALPQIFPKLQNLETVIGKYEGIKCISNYICQTFSV